MSLPTNLPEMEKYIIVRWAYSIGQPLISDPEYDVLDYAMRQAYPDNPYCQRTWSDDPCPTELLRKYDMVDYIRAVTLGDKTESIPSLNTAIEVRNTLGNISGKGTLSMKHDGWNVQCNYYNGELIMMHTRGRSSDHMDVSALMQKVPKKIPAQGKVKVVCEATINDANFLICKKIFSNVSQRSAVSSVLARPEYHYMIDLHGIEIHGVEFEKCEKFNLLTAWGFSTPEWVYVTDYNSLLDSLEFLSNRAPTYPSPSDGVVYDGQLKRAIRLLYWEEPIYKSYVTGYEENYGPNRISPSVLIRQILRKGPTQKQLSLTNWARIIEYDLRKGAPIAFRIASDSTADFDEESTRALHTQWLGRWDEYRQLVDANEQVKQWEQQT